MVMSDLAGGEIKSNQSCDAKTVIAVIDRPQAVVTVDDYAQHRIKKMGLDCAVWVRDCCSVDPLKKFVSFRSGLRVHSEKNAPVRSDCHIANGLGVAQDFLKGVFAKQRFCRQVVVMFAAAVTYPHEQHGQAADGH